MTINQVRKKLKKASDQIEDILSSLTEICEEYEDDDNLIDMVNELIERLTNIVEEDDGIPGVNEYINEIEENND